MRSDRLQALMKERGINALTLSRELSLPKSLVYEWVGGKREPSAANLRRLSGYFSVSMGYLLGEEENEEDEELILLLRRTRMLSEEEHRAMVLDFKRRLSGYLAEREERN